MVSETGKFIPGEEKAAPAQAEKEISEFATLLELAEKAMAVLNARNPEERAKAATELQNTLPDQNINTDEEIVVFLFFIGLCMYSVY